MEEEISLGSAITVVVVGNLIRTCGRDIINTEAEEAEIDMLNPSPPEKTDNGQTQYPSSVIRKLTTDERRQTSQIGYHRIGGDNVGVIGTPLI